MRSSAIEPRVYFRITEVFSDLRARTISTSQVNPTFAQGFSAYSLTQKPERSGGWRREMNQDRTFSFCPLC